MDIEVVQALIVLPAMVLGNGLVLCGTAKNVEKESSGSPFNDNRNSPAFLCGRLAVQVGQ